MFDRLKPEELFLEHLPWIEKVATRTCSTRGIWGDDADDFIAWVRTELIEDDYAVFRMFRGDSKIETYLAAVVARRFHDYWRERLGRWRPSAAAERMGPPARDLEALVHRDGYSLSQAGEKLRTAGRTTLTDTELARLLESLPPRTPLRPVQVVADAALDSAPDPSNPDEEMEAAAGAERHARLLKALGNAMEQLDPDDQMIMRMHFQDGYTLAHVARTLRVEQKPLYRRVERLRRLLQESLENGGVHSGDVRKMLGDEEEE